MNTIHPIDKDVFWDALMKIIEDSVNVQSFNTWFKPISLEDISDHSLVISVPKAYFSSWLEELKISRNCANLEIISPYFDNTPVNTLQKIIDATKPRQVRIYLPKKKGASTTNSVISIVIKHQRIPGIATDICIMLFHIFTNLY